MNYREIYQRLIRKAQERTIPKHEYSERHHTFPRCMGGMDDDYNIVELYPREHYIAHQLLAKMYPNEHGLIFAAFWMAGARNKHNSHRYEYLRQKSAEATSRLCKGKPLSDKHKAKISAGNKGKTRLAETKAKMSAAKKDKPQGPLSNETKAKISAALKGKPLPDETKAKMSAAKKGKPQGPLSDEHKAKLSAAWVLRKLKQQTL